jgi:hypothetical protein
MPSLRPREDVDRGTQPGPHPRTPPAFSGSGLGGVEGGWGLCGVRYRARRAAVRGSVGDEQVGGGGVSADQHPRVLPNRSEDAAVQSWFRAVV